MAGSLDSQDGEIGFQIAPMVDVVFVLMMFFLACAGWQVKEKRLEARLPISSGSPQVAIVIDISADGQVMANDQPFGTEGDKSLEPLRAWLKTTRRFGTDNPIVIHPNPTTRHERIMDVLNACKAAGIEKVTFS